MALPPEFKDPLWRIQNLYKIRDKERRLIKFTPKPRQRVVLDEIGHLLREKKPIRRLDAKARQMGFSTLFGIIYLDDTIWTPNTISGIIAHARESLGYIWEIIRLAHATMPGALRPNLIDDSKTTLSFETNSKIMVSLKIQSTAVHNLHISEYAFCDQSEVEQTIAACPPWANITKETTTNGMNFVFHEWGDHKVNEVKRFHPWFLQPEYRIETGPLDWSEEEKKLASYALKEYGHIFDNEQIAFRRQKQNELKHLFYSEFAEDVNTCFLSSGNSFFNNRKMDALVKEADEPVRTGDCYEIWEEPQKGHAYCAGADVAKGEGIGSDRDYSVLAILCKTCKKQAFRFRGRVGLDHFFRVCDEWGRKYNNAILAPEINGIGEAVLLGLQSITKYPNIYFEESNRAQQFGKKPVEVSRSYGWKTNEQSKKVMVEGIRQAIEGEFTADENAFQTEFKVSDKEFLQECFSFINKEGKLEASAGKHDDLIMAWAIAYQMFLILKGSKPAELSNFLIGGKAESTQFK